MPTDTLSPFAGFLDSARALGRPEPPPDLAPATGPFAGFLNAAGKAAWSDDSIPAEQRFESFLRTTAASDRKWEDVAGEMQRRFGVDPEPVRQSFEKERGLGRARAGVAGTAESNFDRVMRSTFPFASAGFRALESGNLSAARERIGKGGATPEDYRTVAVDERRRQIKGEQGTGEALLDVGLSMPALIGETLLAGRAMPLRQPAAVAGPSILTREGARAALRAAPGEVARGVARSPAVPSMWLTMSADRAAEQGGNFYDAPNVVPALAYSALQVGVLGHSMKLAGRAPGGRVGGTAIGAAMGFGEQQAGDAFAGAVDEVLEPAWQTKTRYGAVAGLLRGDEGALKEATVQAVTMAAFAAFHGRPPRAVLEPYAKALDGFARKGQSKATAGEALEVVGQRWQSMLEENPTATKAEWAERTKDLTGEVGEYARSAGAGLEDRPAPVVREPEGVETVRPVEPQPEPTGGLTPPAAEPAPSARPEQPAPGLETAQDAPGRAISPEGPVAAREGEGPAARAGEPGTAGYFGGLTESQVRETARRFGLRSDGKIESLVERINESPSALAAARGRAAAVRQPAAEEPRPVKAAGQSGEFYQTDTHFLKAPENPALVASEVAASKAAALLGVNVLPTEAARVGGKPAVRSPLLGEHEPLDKAGDAEMSPDQVARVGLTEWLLHASDRTERNYAVRSGGKAVTAIDYAEAWHPKTFRNPDSPVGPYTSAAYQRFAKGGVPLPRTLISEVLSKQPQIEALAREGVSGLDEAAQAEALGLLRQKFAALRSLSLKREPTLSSLPTYKGTTPDDAGAATPTRTAAGGIPIPARPIPRDLRKKAVAGQQEKMGLEQPTAPELRAEKEFAQTRFEDIPEELRVRVDANARGLSVPLARARQTARSAFAGGGEEGLRVLLDYQEARLRPATAGELERAERELKQAEEDDAIPVSEADALRINRAILERRLHQAAETAAGAVPGGRTEAQARPGTPPGEGRPAEAVAPKKGSGLRREARPGKTLDDAVISFGGIRTDSAEFKRFFSNAKEAREHGLSRPGLFRKGGLALDDLATQLHAEGHLPDADPQTLVDMLLGRKESHLHADDQGRAARAYEERSARQEAAVPAEVERLAGLRERYVKLRDETIAERDTSFPEVKRTGERPKFPKGYDDRTRVIEEYEQNIAELDARLKALEPVERGEADDEGLSVGPETEVAPGVFFGQPTGARTGTTPTAAGKPTGPFEIIATAEKLLGPKRYIEKKVPHSRAAAAAYLQDPRAIVAGKMHAGDAAVDVHERGHDIAAEHGLPGPAELPADVRNGFKRFDYDQRRPMGKTAILEGFSEWLRLRQTDQLKNLTPDQQAAAKYAEEFVQKAGLTAKLDRLREMFRRLESSTPEQQAAGLVSATGRPAGPEQTRGEAAGDALRQLAARAQDDIDNDLGVLLRMQEAHRKRLGRIRPGEDPYTVYSQLMFADRARAGEFERDGVHTIEGGRKVVIGQSLDQITEGARPEWLAQGTDGGPSRAGTYALTRHVLGEFARGEKPVPDEQRAVYERAMMVEFRRDREFVAWAEPFAERLTRAFNDTRRALASPDVHLLTPEAVDALERKRPDYVPLERVVSDKGWKVSQGTRGEQMAEVLKGRSGSGEQVVDPLVSLKKRYLVTSALLGEQVKRNAVANLLTQPGMGEWGVVAGDAVGLTEAGKLQADKLRDLGVSEEGLRDILRGIGPDLGTHYFSYRPWPTDGSKPTWWWVGPEGKAVPFRIGDRALYDLLTGQQVDAHQTARVINGIANFGFEVPGVGRVEPIRASTQLVKTGATTASLGFHVRNVPRDVWAFWTNTIDRASVGQLPDAFRRAYAFAWAELTGKVSKDVLFAKFRDLRGDQLRQFAFDRAAPETAYGRANLAGKPRAIRAAHSVWGVAKDILNVTGAGELAPRFREFVNRLKQTTGLTEAQLTEKLEAADKAAADGSPYREPLPFHLLLDAMNAAAEVTTPFGRQGTVTRQVNAITPFFGPAISGLSKQLRNWRHNPKGAAFAMSAALALRALHWALFSDEEWYQELSDHDRFNNFVVPTPVGLRRVPGPRGFEVPGGGFLVTMLDAAAGKNPDFKGLVRQSFESAAPPLPVPPPVKAGYEVGTNRNWMGSPIVPRRDEGMPTGEKLLRHQGPYLAEQLTGGLAGRRNLPGSAADLLPVSEVRNARRSVDDYYDKLHDLDAERDRVRRSGRRFEREDEYQKLHKVERRMAELNREARGERLAGGRVVRMERPPTEERRAAIRAEQVKLARQALGK